MTRHAAFALLTVALAGAMGRCTTERGRAVLFVVPKGASAPPSAELVVYAEIAATNAERNRGLGGRAELAPDAGMLFAYPSAQEHVFWMKDCLIPLDIAFVGADGAILNVATLPAAAGLPDQRIPRTRSEGAAQWVIETRAGWFGAHHVGAGDQTDLRAALVGVRPE